MGMNEKRFVHKNESIIDTQTDELVNASSEEGAKIITAWLNELFEDCNDLKKENYGNLDGINYYQEQNGHLESRISNLECENEQLKSEIEKVTYANEELLEQKRNWEKLSDEYAKLYDENEQLKKEIKSKDKIIELYYEMVKE